MNIGLLVVRVVIGLLMGAHGAQKLFGWFGGYGLAGTGAFLDSLGFRPGRLFAAVAAAGEVIGGLLVALGFLGPVGPALMVAVMLVALLSVHWGKGVFAASNGVELPLLYAAAAVGLALTGPGAYSLDAAFGLTSLSSTHVGLGALTLGILAGAANLAVRRPAPVEA